MSTLAFAPDAGAGLVRSTATVTRRALLRYVRTPQLIVMATIQMSMFFLIYRFLFGGAIKSVGLPYVDFLVPGFIATGVLTLASAVTVGIAFAVGFRLHGSAVEGLAAFGLVIVFGFAFEWLFVTMGLFAGNAQAAQGMGMIVFPFAFISRAYVPVASMPSWLQAFAAHQPLTYMVNAVRALTLGPEAQTLLGHPAGYFVIRALIWSAAIVAVSLPLAVAK